MSDLDSSNPYDPEGLQDEKASAEAPLRPLSSADEIAAAPPAPPRQTPPAAPAPPTPWKAAASSIPKLRQQPAALPEAAAGEFPGFAQDVPPASGEEWAGDEGVESGSPTPLSAELPLWEAWLERARALPRPVVIGVGAGVLLLAIAFTLVPRGMGSIPLARIRQHPEAFDGRVVKVQGRAGETFTVGGSFVFDLRQGRDTIVVYSRTRHPSLHERVEATGTVSIGYLDGAPRLALFEEQPTP